MATGQYALCTLTDIQDYYFMKDDGSDIVTSSGVDNLLEDLIDRVSTSFETEMDLNILSREYTQYYDGKGSNMLFTRQYPITVVSGIWDDSEWEWDSTTEIDSDDYRISEGGRYIIFKGVVLGDYDQNIKTILTAGLATVPWDLQEQCVVEVIRAYKNRKEVDVTAKTLADGSVTYTAKGFLPKTKAVLSRYRRKW